MRRVYQLQNGEKLYTWYNNIGFLSIYKDKSGLKEETVLEFDHRSDDPVVEYRGETIHLNDFCYDDVDTIVQKIQNYIRDDNSEYVDSDSILATLMKDTENVGIVMDVECYNTIVGNMGIGLKGSGSAVVNALMVPYVDERGIDFWHYKLLMRAEDERLAPFIGTERIYFSDLCDSINRGYIQLVNKHQYRKEHPVDTTVQEGEFSVLNF